jgi:SulP family sulfate permease
MDLFTPKLVSALREGYGLAALRRDALAGLTVAIVALPLSMAIGIASGATPARGLLTAIVAGFIISALGGSRFQIGGPTAAFIVVVFQTIERHGYDGMLLAALIAGALLIAVGALRLSTYIKYIPYPVIIGFTSGIALSIFASQVRDLLGLKTKLPAEFIPKVIAIGGAISEINPAAVVLALLGVAIIVGLRIYRPSWPGFLIAVVAAAAVAFLFHFDVATIGTEFGGVPRDLVSMPALPPFSLAKLREVFPDAVTIALLAGVESLLSAVVADGMTGRRHRSNVELIAQGVANLASGVFGGLPATGAIARTATNIRAGGKTPVAGMLHAAFLLAFVLVAAPILSFIPLAALAAILAYVAWNIGEFGHIRSLLTSGPMGDRAVLVVTFLLTVLVDLTVAIEVGIVLAAILFMHRMANAVAIETEHHLIETDESDSADSGPELPERETKNGRHKIVYRINGPFFFGATQAFSSVLERIGAAPDVYILDLEAVPFVDASGAAALGSFTKSARAHGAEVIVAAAAPNVRRALDDAGLQPHVRYAPDVETAKHGEF